MYFQKLFRIIQIAFQEKNHIDAMSHDKKSRTSKWRFLFPKSTHNTVIHEMIFVVNGR